MSDDSPRSSESSWAIIALVVVLPLLYILSVGPVGLVLVKCHAPLSARQSVAIFYTPITWLHKHTFLKQPLESYILWWERRVHGP